MPTILVDHTSERRGEIWGGFGIGCILKQSLTGTVCFAAGAEFGCGDEKEMGVEKEESLDLKIGAEKHGVGVDLTISTKTTRSEKWTIRSKDCQWCAPEICFPDSRIEVWTCSTVLTLYFHDYDKTYFYPGPVSQHLNNCGPDRDGHCHCKEVTVTAVAPREHIGREGTTMSSMVVTPISFSRQDQQTESNPAAAMDAFASLYEQDIPDPKYAIGVRSPGAPVNWLHPASANAPRELSLLSRGCSDLPDGRAPSPFRGRFLPVLAAAQPSPNAEVEVRALVARPSGQRQEVTGEPQIRTGLFTLIWCELDFGEPLEPGSRVSLKVRLTSPDNRVLTYLSRSYVVLG